MRPNRTPAPGSMSYGSSEPMGHNAPMSLRSAVPVIAALAAATGMAVVVAVGLRGAASSRATPLLAPRDSRAPGLSLGVLAPVALTGAVGNAWERATRDGLVQLSELHGYPVVVNFWASWCDPCRREAPMLERAWRAQRRNVLFLGIDQNDSRGDALAFIRRFAITYPSLHEKGDATAVRWRVRGFPVTFFVAADGRVVAQSIGLLRPAQLRRGIEAARAGRLDS